MEFDLTLRLCQYMDKHFVVHLLDHLEAVTFNHDSDSSTAEDGEFYAVDEIIHAKTQVLARTKMTDAIIDIERKDDELTRTSAGSELKRRKKETLEELEAVEKRCSKLIEFLSDFEFARKLSEGKQMKADFICTNYEIDASEIDALFEWCRLRYDCGVYHFTDKFLGFCVQLLKDPLKKYQAMWGQLAALVLQGKWDEALLSIQKIRDRLEELTKKYTGVSEKVATGDEKHAERDEAAERKEAQLEAERAKLRAEAGGLPSTPIHLMRERVWLMHWALVVCFNKQDALDNLVDLLQSNTASSDFIHSLQTMAPHLLRYLAVAALISRKDRSSKMKELTNVSKFIKDELNNYRDPITEFLRILFLENDFEEASEMLKRAMVVVRGDFFLWYYQNYVLEYARYVFFKQYCRLYSRIKVDKLAGLLLMEGKSLESVHTWIVNALRQEGIKGSLDVVDNVLHIKFSTVNVYKSMDDNAKALNARTLDLVKTLYDRFFKVR